MQKDIAEEIENFSSHELFHAIQANSTFSSIYRNSAGTSNDCNQNIVNQWIKEVSAEAIALMYDHDAAASGNRYPKFEQSYARPIYESFNCGYDRGEFWNFLDLKFRKNGPGSLLVALHDAKPTAFDFQTHGIAWLENVLSKEGSSVRKAMADLIATHVLADTRP